MPENTDKPQAAESQPDEQQVPVSERLMGLIGLVVAVGLAAIAIDLMTGGAVSRLFGSPEDGQPDGG